MCLSTLLAFSSCKNDLNLNAPYKEIPSVYAVLNPQDRIQIIRINKVFLGNSDANTMAKVSDSINYQPGELTVSLKRYINNVQDFASPGQMEIIFRDSLIQADPGVFNTNQRVYVSSAPLFILGDYVLTVYNNHTKNTFTAKSPALDSVKPYYIPFTGPYYPLPPGSPIDADHFVDYSNVGQKYTIRYKANEAKIYQFLMRVHYYDSLLNGNSSSGYKSYSYADYSFGNQYQKDVTTQNDLVTTFKGQDLFNAIGNAMSKLPNNPDVIGRKTYKIQFFVFSATQDYSDYLQYASPSLSINQQKQLYSNFTNQDALGIFTFRSRCSVVKEMDNSFKSAFRSNGSTCSYKFFTADVSSKGCP